MSENGAKIFSLAEANDAIRDLVSLTAEVIQRLDSIRESYKVDSEEGGSSAPEEVLKEIEGILAGWTERVTELGARAKGYFTVDFQSADPELLFCWTYGEDKIAFTHKVWENFSHRRPLLPGDEALMGHLRWVN